jgi:hypothetical protein
VLEQKNSGTGSVEQRAVIDGQQRLTTLQILLKASSHALSEARDTAHANGDAIAAQQAILAGQQLGSLTVNPPYALGEESYKVWPTNDDRAPFRAVMDSDGETAMTSLDRRLCWRTLRFGNVKPSDHGVTASRSPG